MKPPPGKLGSGKSIRSRGAASLDVAWAMVWGAGALLFSVSAIAAFVIAGKDDGPGTRVAGLPLPPAVGEIGATGAIVQDGETVDFAVYPSQGGLAAAQAKSRLEVELGVLRREVAGLRRTLDILQERDRQLSERLRMVEQGKTPAPEVPLSDAGGTGGDQAHPATKDVMQQRIEKKLGKPNAVETAPAPEAVSLNVPLTERGNPEAVATPSRQPVRIVALPSHDEPATVGSIPAPGHKAATPADGSQSARPTLAVSRAAGTIAGDGDGRLARTDFAIDLGVFSSPEDAGLAYRRIKAELGALKANLAPHLAPGGSEKSGQMRLLVGPFPNAADAAAACVLLAAHKIGCQPNVLAGKPLALN
ncbi:SPOR domain-containing protein [Stappia sp. F7233]|uniref:SPOR domain-containing protein n=1 Tax=Stappia albiluteola TaxID=2758565 RepID=A0A839AC37_9HYPH|nr:SPOR domain-containing protein [Stappia albiluteola]MBA5776554.1 SPOR domain-containing protein [Stappia albiluteola]